MTNLNHVAATAVLGFVCFSGVAYGATCDTSPPAPAVAAEVICPGDCNHDGSVTIDELQKSLNIVMGDFAVNMCPAIDRDGDGAAHIQELASAIGSAMHDCPLGRFVPTACALPPPDGQDPANMMCGDLIVPENRAARNGRTIRLAVVVFKATGPDREPDPFVFLSGGPGQWAIETIVPFQTANGIAPIQSHRDVVIFDPRGTGHSQPAFECPELPAPRDAFAELLTPEQENERDAAALLACRDRLGGEGYDLGAYNSAAMAQDIDTLMTTLGYGRYNLYGFSYGTRVALTALRDLPAGRIRSVVLDSVAPLQVALSLSYSKPTADALELMFEDCAAQPDCNAAYPNLRDTFFAAVEHLNTDPLTMHLTGSDGQSFTVTLTGDRLVRMVSTAIQDAPNIPYMPMLFQAAADCDMDFLAEFLQAVTGPTLETAGVKATVICNEDAPFVTPAIIDAMNQGADTHILHAFANPDIFGRICSEWGSPTPAAIENEPVTSDVPALVLAGQYDDSTPHAWSQQAAETLSHSTYIEFRGFGHVVIGQQYDPAGPPTCAMQIIAQFIDNPSSAPQNDCVEAIPPPVFLVP